MDITKTTISYASLAAKTPNSQHQLLPLHPEPINPLLHPLYLFLPMRNVILVFHNN
uniref:Uncharacterized protein n=1 Tax=Lepeophtheirus salmonis TaxID=72036 RepID=A0A0K2VD06_LEPSM